MRQDGSRERSGATLTRRGFLARGAGLAAGAVVAGSALGVLSGCGSSSSDADVDVLAVAENAVTTLDAFTNIKKPSRYYTAETLAMLDAGCMLFSSDGKVAAVLSTGETADPLSTAGLLELSSGTYQTVLSKAEGEKDGFSIYAVRASSELLVWVESNYLTSDWRVYCATVDAGSLSIGSAVKLDEGDVQYDAPEIAVIGSTAFWIVQPAENGSKTSESSQLKAASGGSAASTVLTSNGRFNGGLSVSDQVLTAMPRADASGVYYQLTAIQSGTGAVIAKQVLPKSFKPSCAIYVNGSFSFAIGASYDYGDGIRNVGTYYPMGNGEWLRIAKTPVTPLGLCKGWLFCKSGSRTVFIDTTKRRYFTVDAPSDSASYGDYPIVVGSTSRVYNYATVSKVSGSKEKSKVVVRSIVPTSIS